MKVLLYILLVGLVRNAIPQIANVFPQVPNNVPQMQNAVPQMSNPIPQIPHAVPQMQNAIPQMQNTVPQMQNTVPQMQSAVPQMQNAILQTTNAAPQMANAAPQMQNAVPQMQNAILRTTNAAPQMANSVPQMANVVPEMQNAVPQMQNAVPQMQNAVPQMANAVPQMQNAVPQMQNAAPRTTNAAPQILNAIRQPTNSFPQMPNAAVPQGQLPIGQLSQQGQLQNQPNQDNSGQPAYNVGQQVGNLGQPSSNMGQQNVNFGQPIGDMGQVYNKLQQTVVSAGQINNNLGQLPNTLITNKFEGQRHTTIGLPVLNNIAQSNNMGQAPNNMGQPLNNMGQLTNNLGQVANHMGQVANNMGQVANSMGQVPNTMGHVPNNLEQVANNIGQIPNNMGQLPNNVGPVPDTMGQVPNNVGQVPNTMAQVPNSMGQVPNNVEQVPNNLGQFNNGVQIPKATPAMHNVAGQPTTKGPFDKGNAVNGMGQLNSNAGQGPNSVGQSISNMGQQPNAMGQPNTNVGQLANPVGQPSNNLGQQSNQMGQTMNNYIGQVPNVQGQFGNNMGQQPGLVGQLQNTVPQVPQSMGQPGDTNGQQPNLMGKEKFNAGFNPGRQHIVTTTAAIVKPFECKSNMYNENLLLNIPAKSKEVLPEQFLRTECKVATDGVAQLRQKLLPIIAQFPLENKERLLSTAENLCVVLPPVDTSKELAGSFHVMDPDSKLYAYSAYFDTRLNDPTVRIWAIGPLRGVPVFCQVGCEGTESHTHVRRGVVEFITVMDGPDQNCAWNQFLINCPWTEKCIPNRVSITRTPCGTPHSVLPVTRLGSMDSEVPLTSIICTTTIFDYNDEHVGYLAEFTELYKLYGVEKVFLYDTYNVSVGMEQVLQYYEKQGFIVRVPWKIPKEVSYLFYFAQVLQYNDCIYRNMDTAKYIGLFDFDDIFIPAGEKTWKDTLEHLSRTMVSGNGDKIASYKFPWSTICPLKNNGMSKESYVKPPGSERKISSRLSNFQVAGKFHAELKQIVVPRRVFRAHVHGLHYKWPGYGEINPLSPLFGLVYHYGDDPSHCKELHPHLEILVCKRLPEIEINVARSLSAAGVIVPPKFLENLPPDHQPNARPIGVLNSPIQSQNIANIPRQGSAVTTGKPQLPPISPIFQNQQFVQFPAQNSGNIQNSLQSTPKLFQRQDSSKTTPPLFKPLSHAHKPQTVNPLLVGNPSDINVQTINRGQNSEGLKSGQSQNPGSIQGTENSKSKIPQDNYFDMIIKKREYMFIFSLCLVFIMFSIIRRCRKTLNRPLRQLC